MAEGIFLKKLSEKNLTRIKVSSAGTCGIVGSKASEESIYVCQEIGVDIKSHLSQAVTLNNVIDADLILVMENNHLEFIINNYFMFNKKEIILNERIMLLGSFSKNNNKIEIDDPYGASINFYRKIRDIITICVDNCIQAHFFN